MKQNRSNLALGLILLIIGGWLLVTRQVPSLQAWMEDNFTWPMWTIGAGVLVLLIGLLTNAPGMAVPASIIAGIGGILYYQNNSSDWVSWSYAWALIPAFVGVGMILAAVLGGKPGKAYREALEPITFGLTAFVIIGSFFNAFTGVWGVIAPAILIAVGAILLVRNFLRK